MVSLFGNNETEVGNVRFLKSKTLQILAEVPEGDSFGVFDCEFVPIVNQI
jgi:hypothetical protein